MEVGALQAAARRHLTLRTAFPPRLYLVVCLVHNPIPPTSEAADGAWQPTQPLLQAHPPIHSEGSAPTWRGPGSSRAGLG